MLKSIVHIESANQNNKSFGTGFIIDNDEHGAYILTCQHVLDEVGTAVVEKVAVEIVAQSDFLDMAVIHVKGLKAKALPLQVKSCHNDKVRAIGFATFSKTLVQKKEINGTLFHESIELHSKVDDAFYVVRRVKADDDYSFERGNSGAPLICQDSGAVIAMISNKEGASIAYAIEIACLQEIWKDLNNSLKTEGNLHNHQHFYENINKFTKRLKENNNSIEKALEPSLEVDKEVIKITHMDELQNKHNKMRYYLLGMSSVILVASVLYLFMLPKAYQPENYKIVHIPTDDVLNIRKDKGTVYPIVGVIPYDAENIAVTICKANDAGKEWCRVTYGDVTGWVRSKYIEKEIESDKNININDKSYFRALNQEVFLQFTYPPSVKRGETILISALLENQGKEEKTGGITLSFPQRPKLNYDVDYNDFEVLTQYKIFDEIYNNHPNQTKTMKAIHPSIEAQKATWSRNESHIFALAITAPKALKIFRIRVRGSLTVNRVVPQDGTLDQQAFKSQEIVIRIED